jgi:hypothetical protein
VIQAISAFDVLAKRHHADVESRLLLPDRVDVRQDEWRSVVERMLVETLAAGARPVPADEEVIRTASS